MFVRRWAAALAALLLATGCAGRGPLRLPQTDHTTPVNNPPSDNVRRASLQPHLGSGNVGPTGHDISPHEHGWANQHYVERDGYSLAVPQWWRATDGPPLKLAGPDGVTGEIERLAAVPADPSSVRVPGGCKQVSKQHIVIRPGPALLTQFHCTPVGGGAFDQANVYFTSFDRPFFFWLRGKADVLGKLVDMIGGGINVQP